MLAEFNYERDLNLILHCDWLAKCGRGLANSAWYGAAGDCWPSPTPSSSSLLREGNIQSSTKLFWKSFCHLTSKHYFMWVSLSIQQQHKLRSPKRSHSGINTNWTLQPSWRRIYYRTVGLDCIIFRKVYLTIWQWSVFLKITDKRIWYYLCWLCQICDIILIKKTDSLYQVIICGGPVRPGWCSTCGVACGELWDTLGSECWAKCAGRCTSSVGEVLFRRETHFLTTVSARTWSMSTGRAVK